jgi:hypothetical protein
MTAESRIRKPARSASTRFPFPARHFPYANFPYFPFPVRHLTSDPRSSLRRPLFLRLRPPAFIFLPPIFLSVIFLSLFCESMRRETPPSP